MKRILFIVAIIISTATFAQKEELKVLKKVYSKDTPSKKDIVAYKEALSSLEAKATEESDKVYANFFKGMLPFVELANLGENAKPQDLLNIFSSNSLNSIVSAINETLNYEKDKEDKLYTDDINETLSFFKPVLKQTALQLNSTQKYKEASDIFYSIYRMDQTEGASLENAALLAVQSQDFVSAEKLYNEFKNSDYLENGKAYFAVNKASGHEEPFSNKDEMLKMISFGTHEKPRTVNASEKKPEVYKILTLLNSQNGNIEEAKKNIEIALKLNPNDKDLIEEGSRIYFNEAYEILKDDQKLVDEINQNLDKKDKYDELSNKRKSNFEKALPKLEKAYMFDSQNQNTKSLLKISYEILGMKEKAASIN